MRTTGPTPLSRTLSDDRVEAHRNLGCRRYDACLDRAAKSDWVSWTCTRCERFACRGAEAPPSVEHVPQPVSAAPARARRAVRCGPARTAHSLEVGPGELRVSLRAPSLPELFVEAARAASELVEGRPCEPAAACDEEIGVAADDRDALLGEWVRALVLRAREKGARFAEHDIVHLSDHRVVGQARGPRLAQCRGLGRELTSLHPSIETGPDGFAATVVLEMGSAAECAVQVQ